MCYAGSSNGNACSSPPTGSIAYKYDAADNLTQKGLTQQAFNNADELCWTASTSSACSTPPSGATTYQYDTRGNRTNVMPNGGQSQTLTYDQANRLTIFAAASTTSYGYNGDGLRMCKYSGSSRQPCQQGGATQILWDVAASLALLLKDGSTAYVYGPGGLPLEQVNPSATYWYHHDQLGSTRLITNSTATSPHPAIYTYDPYGGLASITESITNPLRFASQYQDPESGSYYLRNRYYDPSTAQFLSMDPAAAATVAPYAYTSDNPLNGQDPRGLWPNWQAGWNAFSSGMSQIGGQLEQSFHQNAAAISNVAHGAAMVCGTAALVLLVGGITSPAAAIAGGCAIAASLVAAAADADMAAHGDPGHGWGDVAWDLAGVVPDLGAEGSLAKEEYYMAKYEKGLICHKAYAASRNTAEFYQQAAGYSWLAGAANEYREIDHMVNHHS